ncbi:unnamed protein product, partial [Prunus brigantina]
MQGVDAIAMGGSHFGNPDPDYNDDDPDSDDDLDPEYVYDSYLDPDFDSDPDSALDPNPDSYETCIICIFRCTNYDFPLMAPAYGRDCAY